LNLTRYKGWIVARTPPGLRQALFGTYRQLYGYYRRLRTTVTGQGWPIGHHYSPLVDVDYCRRNASRIFETPTAIGPDIDLNAAVQDQTLAAIAAFYPDFDWGERPSSGRRYHLDNRLFIYGDAIALYGLIRWLRPRRVIEVGSGFSSALMLDTVERHPELDTEFVFIEPFSSRLEVLQKAGSARSRTIKHVVQDVPLDEFRQLAAGDILFIDSSHVAKTGSDVNFLTFEVLPHLQPGVIVHFHDILWPFEYPRKWVVDLRWSWNEAYLVRAFLQFNTAFEILLFNSYVGEKRREVLAQRMPLALKYPGASLWLRRRQGGGGNHT
jgi:predicted O-methyltransferase YrrM